MITLQQAADFLQSRNNFTILTHQYPDGDTLGSGFALCKMLQQTGKNARVLINGALQDKFLYLADGVKEQSFNEETVVSVDVADCSLLGELSSYKDKVDMAIDHHLLHKNFTDKVYVDSTAAATAEIIYRLGVLLNVSFNKDIADCIFTGLTTDTGCFRYTNTTAQTHIIAAKMIEFGCMAAEINKAMFEMVSKRRIAIECMVMQSIRYYADGKCAVIYTTQNMLKQCQITDDELEGLASLPRQIVGVKVGVTVREKSDGVFKISVRTNDGVDASRICSAFGGGGHAAAAGCSVKGTLEETINKVVEVIEKELAQSI